MSQGLELGDQWEPPEVVQSGQILENTGSRRPQEV